jgi:hypothetical protein
MPILEQFMRGLDTHKPDWLISFANQSELADCARACTEGHSGTVAAKTMLRKQVACRLIVILDAACNAGIVNID